MKITKLLKSVGLAAGIALAVLTFSTPKTSADFSISIYSQMYGYNYQPVSYPQIVGYVSPQYNNGLRVANTTVDVYQVVPTWYMGSNLQYVGSVMTDQWGNYYFNLGNYGYNYYNLYATQMQFVVRANYQNYGLYGGDTYLTFSNGTTACAPLILDMTTSNYFGPYSNYSGNNYSGNNSWFDGFMPQNYNTSSYLNPSFSLYQYATPSYDLGYQNGFYDSSALGYNYGATDSSYSPTDVFGYSGGVNYSAPTTSPDWFSNSYLGDNSYADSIWGNNDKQTSYYPSDSYNTSYPSDYNSLGYTPNSYDSLGLSGNSNYGSTGLDYNSGYGSTGLGYDLGYGSNGLGYNSGYDSTGLGYDSNYGLTGLGDYGSSGLNYDSGYGSSGLGGYSSTGLDNYGSTGLDYGSYSSNGLDYGSYGSTGLGDYGSTGLNYDSGYGSSGLDYGGYGSTGL